MPTVLTLTLAYMLPAHVLTPSFTHSLPTSLTHPLPHPLTHSLFGPIDQLTNQSSSNPSTNEVSLVTVSSYQASFRQTPQSLCSLNTTSLASKMALANSRASWLNTKGFLSSPALFPSGRHGCVAAGPCCTWSSQPKLVGTS